MNVLSKTEDLRRAALDYLWMHNRSWIDMAEHGRAGHHGRWRRHPCEGLRGPHVDRPERRVRLSERRVWKNGHCRGRARADDEALIPAARRGDRAAHPRVGEDRRDRAGVDGARLSRQRRLRVDRDGDQDRPGLPQAQRRAGPVQGHQPSQFVPRRDRRRPLDGGERVRRPLRLRAVLSGHDLRAAAEPLPVRVGGDQLLPTARCTAPSRSRNSSSRTTPTRLPRSSRSRSRATRATPFRGTSTGRWSATSATGTESCWCRTRSSAGTVARANGLGCKTGTSSRT